VVIRAEAELTVGSVALQWETGDGLNRPALIAQ
jgi:hypothetical protein